MMVYHPFYKKIRIEALQKQERPIDIRKNIIQLVFGLYFIGFKKLGTLNSQSL